MLLFVFTISLGQNSNLQIKRVQRTIFIFNLSQQVAGYAPALKDKITIGVLGADRTIIDLKVMAQRRKIAGKPVSIVSFQKVKDIADIDILYVHNKYNFEVDYILNSIAGEQILLISEEYKYNASMINIVGVGDGFEYEINKNLLSSENFRWAPSLEKNAISSSEKWKLLFIEAQDLLKKEQEELQKKKNELVYKDTILEEQQKKLSNIADTVLRQKGNIKRTKELLLTKEDSILQLWSLNEIQAAKYEDKVLLEQELENQIVQQLTFLREKQQEIYDNELVLSQQQVDIETQTSKIENQIKALDSQEKTISQQRTILILIGLVAALLLLSAFLLHRGYRKTKKLNSQLLSKNEKIAGQAKQLVQKNTELEQFAYIASHDLKEPVNTISSLIGLLEEEHGETFNETTKQSFAYMAESASRMSALIEALLNHSKLGFYETKEEVDCNELVQTIKRDLSKLISDSNASIYVSALPKIEASAIEIRQVFQNLITNAIKFGDDSKAPEVSINSSLVSNPDKVGQSMWRFSITDNGIGIAEKYQERIFAIFQRLHAKETYEGTGIGLAHSKKIIESHGGTIWVDSTEGEGSTFYFTIPIEG